MANFDLARVPGQSEIQLKRDYQVRQYLKRNLIRFRLGTTGTEVIYLQFFRNLINGMTLIPQRSCFADHITALDFVPPISIT